MMAVCLFTFIGLQAQTIQNGSKWWDGSVLYTATVDASGSVKMNGIDAHEGGFTFWLSKAQGTGEYKLGTDANAGYLPVRGEDGWRVQYIRQDGMYFLAIRKPNNDVIWTLLLTPDNLEHLIAQEKYAEEQPVSDNITSRLLNTTYLGKFSKPELRLMRNEILARHGWKFQSKDLQEHFGSKLWYKPVDNNKAITLNIIEQTNIQLIKSEEAVPDENRYYSYKAENYPGGLAEDGRGPDLIDGEEVYTVTSELDFLNALGSERTILIDKDIHLNLSRVLENEGLFKKVPGRRWTVDASTIIGSDPYVVSEVESDGRQLSLVNMKHLTIKGAHNASIEVDPRYSFCINFVNCEGCTLENLTIGHTEYGTCSGGVIGVTGGRMNVIKECDLYGCGTYGIDVTRTNSMTVMNTNIHDCTYGILQLRSSLAVKFFNCDFFNNKEYGLIESWGSEDIVFDNCRFFSNKSDSPLFNFDTEFYLMGCSIYHPTESLGTIDMAVQSGAKNSFSSKSLDASVKPRGIGPK